jgi:tripartite-type tricarboxylate transporter receptor subunit TctC
MVFGRGVEAKCFRRELRPAGWHWRNPKSRIACSPQPGPRRSDHFDLRRLRSRRRGIGASSQEDRGSEATISVRSIIPIAPLTHFDSEIRSIASWGSGDLIVSSHIDLIFSISAATNIGTLAVVHAPDDGSTLVLLGPPAAINPTLYDKLNFNVIRDIAPIARIARARNVLEVGLSVPATTVSEFIAYAKANPGKLNVASSGVGSSPHMSGELFKMMAGVNLVHVPYRGSVAALTDMLSGRMQVFFDNLPASISWQCAH